MAIDYGDMFNRYAQARLDRAFQPFEDPEAYLNQRLQNQYGVNLDEQGNVKPRSTTITNNDDGSQTITTKHELTPQEPVPTTYALAPQQAQPTGLGLQMPQAYAQPMTSVAPQQMPAAQVTQAPAPQVVEQPQQVPTPLARPVAPVAETPAMATPQAPIAPNEPAPQMTQLPQPGPGVQLAGPMVPGAVPNAPAAVPQVNQAPAMGQGITVPQQAQQHWSQQIADLGNSAPKLAAYYGNENNDAGGRKVAADLYAIKLQEQQKNQEAENTIDKAISGDPRAATQLTRDLTSKKEEGSYLKAILLARLGLTDLAKEEQQKLGGGTTMVAMVGKDGQNYSVELASNGEIKRAWDSAGDRVTDKTKAALQAYALNPKNVTTHTGKMQDITNNKVYYEQTTPNGIRLIDNQGNTYNGPSENLRPFGIGSDIQTKGLIALQGARIKLEGLKAEDRVRALEDVNKKRIAEGLPAFSTSEIGIDANGRFVTQGGGVNPTEVPKAITETDQAALRRAQGDVAALDREIAATRPTETNRIAILNQERAKAQQRVQEAGGVAATTATATTVPPAAAGVSTSAGGSTAELIRQRETAAAIAQAGGSEEAKKIADIKVKLPTFERSVANTLYTLNDVLTHPGFGAVVGKPDLLTAPISMLPSSDMRDFRSKFSQLKAQQFLNAFDQLRGAGSITEKEGDTATAAVSALQDTGISQDSFRKNAWILKDTLQRGIDTQRQQVGQPPKYVSSDPKIEQAREWVRNHPNDPKVLGVIRTLQAQGF